MATPNEVHIPVEEELVPLHDFRTDVRSQDHQNRPTANDTSNVETLLNKRDGRRLQDFLKDPGDHNQEIRSKLLLHRAATAKKHACKYMIALLSVVDDETLSEKDSEGLTVLHFAVLNGCSNCCKAILNKNKQTLAHEDKEGNTPLHYVVKREKNNLCETIVEHCSEEVINKPNNDGLTPVHFSAMERNPKIMKLLLDNGGDPQALTGKGYTPLHYAAKSGSYRCIQFLLRAVSPSDDKEADLIKYMNMRTEDGKTALMFAAKQNLKPICQILIKTDVSLKSSEEKTALHYAAERNTIKVVKCIVESIEANYSEEYKKKMIPFDNEEFVFKCLKASINGKSEECFAYFLEKANEVELSSNFVKDLVDLAAVEFIKCIKSLCRRKEFQDYLEEYRDKKGNTLLHLAIMTKSYGTAKTLLNDLYFNKLIKNNNDDSPLHLLAGQSCNAHVEGLEDWNDVTRELAAASHELVNSTNANGETPLFLASGSGNVCIVKALLRKEPNILRETRLGKTAIHIAAENGRTTCLKLLLHSLKSTELEQLHSQQDSSPLHLASGKGHAECCKVLLDKNRAGKDFQKYLLLKDKSGQYPVDKAFKNKHPEIFTDLLFKMQFDEHQEEFSARLHGYFKKSVHCLTPDRKANCEKFCKAVLDAVIESSWCKVAFDGRFCSQAHLQLHDTQENEGANVKAKPCDTFGLLIKKYPDLACKVMNKHITQMDQRDELELHDYTPFEFIYHATEDNKAVSPFVRKPKATRNKNNTSNQTAGSSSNDDVDTLRKDFEEFENVSWYTDHPLQKAVQERHAEVLSHKLTQSWLHKKLRYTRRVLYPYFLLDLFTAIVAAVLLASFWNTHHLQVRFSGTTRHDVATVYGSDLSYDSTVRALVQDVHYISGNDSHCATWGTSLQSSSSELLEPGSAAWNRSVCVIYHLEQKSGRIMGMEGVQLFMFLLHVGFEVWIFRKMPKVFPDLHRVSRIFVRIPSMAFLLLGVSLCDFILGCRQIYVWQIEVVSVLMIWVHVVLMLNKIPRFSGFMPVTPTLLWRYALSLLPLLLFLLAFAISFHFLMLDNLSFATVPYSVVKTLTLMLGDLGYDDIFVNDEYPMAYPVLSNILFVIFIIGVGGLLLNFVVGNPQEKLSKLGDEDNLNRHITHLHLHLFIDECVPPWRRKYACSRAKIPKQLPSHLCVSFEPFMDEQNKNEESSDLQYIAHEVADMKKDIKIILEGLKHNGITV